MRGTCTRCKQKDVEIQKIGGFQLCDSCRMGVSVSDRKSSACDKIVDKLRRTMNYDVNIGKKFKNAEDEVAQLIKEVPELSPCKSQIIELDKEYRVKNNLPV